MCVNIYLWAASCNVCVCYTFRRRCVVRRAAPKVNWLPMWCTKSLISSRRSRAKACLQVLVRSIEKSQVLPPGCKRNSLGPKAPKPHLLPNTHSRTWLPWRLKQAQEMLMQVQIGMQNTWDVVFGGWTSGWTRNAIKILAIWHLLACSGFAAEYSHPGQLLTS